MAKRGAQFELNQFNWNEDLPTTRNNDEQNQEKSSTATSQVMQSRRIIAPKRRSSGGLGVLGTDESSSGTGSLFKSFGQSSGAQPASSSSGGGMPFAAMFAATPPLQNSVSNANGAAKKSVTFSPFPPQVSLSGGAAQSNSSATSSSNAIGAFPKLISPFSFPPFSVTQSSSAATPFSFLSTTSSLSSSSLKSSTSPSNGTQSNDATQLLNLLPKLPNVAQSNAATTAIASPLGNGVGNDVISSNGSSVAAQKSAKMTQSVRTLNQKFKDWICAELLEQDYVCDLSPVFRDYETFLQEILRGLPASPSSSSQSSFSSSSIGSTTTTKILSSSNRLGLPVITATATSLAIATTSSLSFPIASSSIAPLFNFGVAASTSSSSPFSSVSNSICSQSSALKFPAFVFGTSNSSTQNSTASFKFNFAPPSSSTSAAASVLQPAVGGIALSSSNSLFPALSFSSSSSSSLFPAFNAASSTSSSSTFSLANLFAPPSNSNSATTTQSSQPNNTAAANQEGEDAEDYVPPTAEKKSVSEPHCVYSSRCKLFYDFNQSWRGRGVANLFVKRVAPTDKPQLVLRSDDSLASILLNAIISRGVPLIQSESGAGNTVQLMARANPELPISDKEWKESGLNKERPTKFALRFKTGQLAGEFVQRIRELLAEMPESSDDATLAALNTNQNAAVEKQEDENEVDEKGEDRDDEEDEQQEEGSECEEEEDQDEEEEFDGEEEDEEVDDGEDEDLISEEGNRDDEPIELSD